MAIEVSSFVDRLNSLAPDAAVDEIRQLTADPYEPPREAECTRISQDSQHPAVRGAAGFYVFCRLAEEWCNGPVTAPVFARISELLTTPEVLEHVYRLYEIPELFRPGRLTLYRVGTTSFILKCRPLDNEPEVIIKLIKPRYHSNRTITQQTAVSKETLNAQRLAFAPHVFDSASRYVIMEFIPGPTLSEEIERRRGNQELLMQLAGLLLRDLPSSLQTLAQLSRPHLDLSPDNIIIDLRAGRPNLRTP